MSMMEIDDETQAKIVAAVRRGSRWPVAATAAGVFSPVFETWQKRAAAGEERYRALFDALEQADAELEAELVAIVSGAALGGNKQAAGWLLSRRFPRRAR